ncbi:MAG: glycosyltransferase [Candidatus Aenigmarchaeota archaeon]|nr:glycosyltransferase [Candidatus Aenigmarchaeota archaeon]
MISIIILAHNEELNIKKAIISVLNELKNYDYEIIAVNDNSDDSTGKILNVLSKKHTKVKVFHKIHLKSGPTGLGSALRYGFSHAHGSVLIPFMGDLSDDPRDIVKLIKKINEGYDVVVGSRFIDGSKLVGYPPIKLVCNRLYNEFFRLIFFLHIKDISNAFKAYKRKVIDTIKPKSKGFEITSEIILKAHIMGFKITEVPVSWSGRREGKSKFGSFFAVIKVGFMYVKLSLILWLKFYSKVFQKTLNLLKFTSH